MLEEIDLQIESNDASQNMEDDMYPTATSSCYTKLSCSKVNPC